MDMGKSVNVLPQQSTAKQKPCAYFLGYTVNDVDKSNLYSIYSMLKIEIRVAARFMVYEPYLCVKHKHW